APSFVDSGRTSEGMRLHPIRQKGWDTWAKAEILWKLSLNESPLVHFIAAPTRPLARLSSWLAWRGKRIIHTIASMPKPELAYRDCVWAHRVVVLSRASLARALKEGIPSERLVHIPPAIAQPKTPRPELVEELRNHFGLSGRFVLTFPGDLGQDRGAELVIEALAKSKARRSTTLVIATRNKGPASFRRWPLLREMAHRKGVDLRLVGEVQHIHALIAASDLIVFAAQSCHAKVDHPLVLLEAMHLGRPVLITEGSPAHELAEEGGALGTAFDANALSQAIDQMHRDEGLRERWAKAGVQCAQRRTVEAMAQAYEEVYRALEEEA
ncbi:MAG: glycosyltransferase family 4 protein, partial [Sandaracinaceae bacterium]|nr:glycosyltransferase family 4 protein [Sandaracinaceae bacterium]